MNESDDLINFLRGRMPFYLDLLHQMVAINSFTANAEGVNSLGRLTVAAFSELGFSAETIQSINPVFGKHVFLHSRPPTTSSDSAGISPFVALISHLDTVYSPEEEAANDFKFSREDERVYGPGTVDIKGGTVLMYMVFDAIRTLYPQAFEHATWMIGLDASEETLSRDFGTHCLQRIPDRAAACLVFEGGTPNKNAYTIVTSRKGRAEFRVTAEGRGAHAGNYHKQGANAIVQLADIVQKISSFTDYPNQITFNVGVVHGGSVVNRVPHVAEALIEMRAFSPEVFEEGIERMMALNGSTTVSSHDGYPCRVTVGRISRTAPWPRNPETDKLFRLWQDTGRELDINVIPEERGGLSDGNLMWKHFPVLDGLGPAGTNAHCSERSADRSKDQEYVLLPSFIPKAALNITSILKLVKSRTDG
jgi:glutamate carboxypeptidase